MDGNIELAEQSAEFASTFANGQTASADLKIIAGSISELEEVSGLTSEQIDCDDPVGDVEDSESPVPESCDPRDRQNGQQEYHRIVVQNLPKYFGFKQLKTWFSKLGLNPTNIKPTMGKSRRGAAVACYLSFRTKNEMEEAIPKIATTPFRGQALSAKVAEAAPDPYNRPKKNQRARGDNQREMQSSKSPEEEILAIVTNLHHLSYEDQLKAKQNHAVEILRKIDKKFQYNSQGTISWLKQSRGQVCPVEKIKPSPVPEKYRNKCEFSIGYSPAGEKTVGFKLGKYKEGVTHVVSPAACSHINDLMKEIVKVFEIYVRSSTYEPLNERTREGHWHQLTVRTNKVGESMINVHFHPQNLPVETVTEEKERLRKYCQTLTGPVTLTFVYWVVDDRQTFGRRVERMGEELIFGNKDTSFEESLLGYKFKVSPDAFFQVNTPAAEVLYSTILEEAAVTPNTVVLDLCCGTGTIGIVMAKHVKRVYGVELGEAAVTDAVHNAGMNGVENVEFICAKVEDVLDDILKTKLELTDEVVVILDPPRSGVHNSVIELLRKNDRIRRLLYVACAADNEYTVTNLYGLCKNKAKNIGAGERPFVPVRCIPIDLFPLTKNVELLFVFERVSETFTQ